MFEKENEFMSNFYRATFIFAGREWVTVEHAYQAFKSRERILQDHIRGLSTPRLAKNAGRVVDMRNDWPQVKEPIMRQLVRAKFTQNEDMAEKLLRTGSEEIVEDNYWHDNIWGDCTCGKCHDRVGQNLLGKILMEIRQELKDMRIYKCQ